MTIHFLKTDLQGESFSKSCLKPPRYNRKRESPGDFYITLPSSNKQKLAYVYAIQ